MQARLILILVWNIEICHIEHTQTTTKSEFQIKPLNKCPIIKL